MSGDEWSLKQCRWTQEAMLKAGYVVVESLMEEGNEQIKTLKKGKVIKLYGYSIGQRQI